MALPLPAPTGISQSTLVVGALLAAFILYLAVNNRLGVYYRLLVGPGGGTPSTPSTPPTPSINPASPSFNPMNWANRLGCQFRQFFGGSPCQ